MLVSIPMSSPRDDYVQQCGAIADELRDRDLGRDQNADVFLDSNGVRSRTCGYRTSKPDDALRFIRGKLAKAGAPERTVIQEVCSGVGAVHEL